MIEQGCLLYLIFVPAWTDNQKLPCYRALRVGRLFLWDVPRVRPSILTAHPIPCTHDAGCVGVRFENAVSYVSTAPSGTRSCLT
jgi:hypothetical protein